MGGNNQKNRDIIIIGILSIIFITAPTLLCAKHVRNRQRMMEEIETIKMWKLMDTLGLDSQTALKVFPIIKETGKKRLALRMKQHNILKKIEARLKGGKVIEKNLDSLTNQFFDLNGQISRLPKEEYKKLKSVLTETQLARYILFQRRFRRELFHRLMWEQRGHLWGSQGPDAK